MNDTERLAQFVHDNPRLFVLSGAGISTASGIPDYRDRDGAWKGARPVEYRDFVGKPYVRQRYWSRSMLGWPRMAYSQPNVCHRSVAWLQQAGYVERIVTQNVDSLHQRAGATDVIDLHGRLDSATCLNCGTTYARDDWQGRIEALNPNFAATVQSVREAPDGDAVLEGVDYASFVVPDCDQCGGIVKPDVVFFGENVPRPRVAAAMDALAASDALLVLGSSLIVFSGFRFAREADRLGRPIALLNLGFNRADDLATLKLDAPCEDVLRELPAQLSASPRRSA
ncbi:MAG: NAD-dependent protein deacetylase [Pseudomonadota bacterium]